jgi:nitrate reductase gamma subunit
LSTGAYFVSIMVAGTVEIALDGQHTMGQPPSTSPLSLFAGGSVGSFLVLGGVLLLVHRDGRPRALALKVLVSSAICGFLSVIGWALGPSLGMYLWSALHALGRTPPDEAFQNALHSDVSHQLSLFVIWQTGTASLLGFILRRQ